MALGCGGDDPSLECGTGTIEVEGACLPADAACADGTVYQPETRSCAAQCMEGTIRRGAMCIPAIECGPGTMQMGNECVADGSVYCGGNTIFDTELGECVPDPEAICEGDLVYVAESASCVDPDELLEAMADVRELAEPNDPAYNDAAMAQIIDLASGSSSVYGCIEPFDFDGDGEIDSDLDYFGLEVAGPTLLEIRTQGIRGLNAAAVVFAQDEDLLDDGWQRFVLDLSGSGATRQVFLPKGGQYYLAMADARSLLTGLPAGGPNQCYFVQLDVRELPTPSAITPGTPVTGTFGAPAFYSFTASEGQLLFSEVGKVDTAGDPITRDSLVAASVSTVAGVYRSSANEGEEGFVNDALFGLRNDERVLVVVDYVYDLSPTSTRFSLELTDASAVALPEDGSTVDVLHDDDLFRFAYFTAAAGDVVRIQLSNPDSDTFAQIAVFDPTGMGALLCAGCTTADRYFQVGTSGIHYVRFYNEDGVDGETYPVQATLTHLTPTSLTRGTAAPAELATATRAFFTVDLSTAEWIAWSVSNLTGITTARMQLYALGGFGVIDGTLAASDNTTLSATLPRERIVRGLGTAARYLVSFTNTAAVTGGETFDVLVANVPFTDLGMGVPGTDIVRPGETVPADDFARYLVEAEPSTILTIDVSNVDDDVDPVIDVLSRLGASLAQADEGLDGEGEVLVYDVPAAGWVAFAVWDWNEVGGELDLTVSVAPPPYTQSTAAQALTSVCASQGGPGTNLSFTPDSFFPALDDGLSTRVDLNEGGAFPFTFFGDGVSDFVVATNGWLTFGATTSSFIGAQPNAIAPLAADLVLTEACVHRDGERFTVEYRGQSYSGSLGVEMQVVLHTSGRIDFVYGPGHAATSASFIGLRNVDGSRVSQATAIPGAGNRLTFTPN
ncbi:MAG: hypothetical protein KF901_04710 [Myxococcales bacterium]|nr:hypothetical protein [Myxococcales bacterium]